jgi:predicted HTH domain antitoxin
MSKTRIQRAVDRYHYEDLSLAKAADLAGVSWAQMREILIEKGITPRLGPETVEEIEEEAEVLRDFLAARQRA